MLRGAPAASRGYCWGATFGQRCESKRTRRQDKMTERALISEGLEAKTLRRRPKSEGFGSRGNRWFLSSAVAKGIRRRLKCEG